MSMRGNLNEFQRYSRRHGSRPAADALAKRHSPFQRASSLSVSARTT